MSNFWLEICKKYQTDTNQLIIDSKAYYIGDENTSNVMRGFDGQLFFIKITTDYSEQIIKTTNLWYQGELPEAWKKLMPDNAKFIDNEEIF